jgi:hypothetical protein
MPTIVATQEVEIRRSMVQSQTGQIVRPFLENTNTKIVEWLK